MTHKEDIHRAHREKLIYAILENPNINYERKVEELIQKENITVSEAETLLFGWRINIKKENMDYRSLLNYYVKNFKNLDYELVGKNYLVEGRLPQIAIDNILYDWRKQQPIQALEKNWWAKERSEIGNFLGDLIMFYLFAVLSYGIISELNLLSKDIIIFFFSIPIGCAAQYYFNRKQTLKNMTNRLEKIRTYDERALFHGDVNYDPFDEIIARNLKLKDWQGELEIESEVKSIYKIATLIALFLSTIIILKLIINQLS